MRGTEVGCIVLLNSVGRVSLPEKVILEQRLEGGRQLGLA